MPIWRDGGFGMGTDSVLADLKSLAILLLLIVLAILFVLSLAATVGMVSLTPSGVALEVAPVLALAFGILAFAFGSLFFGLLYWQVRFLRGRGAEPRLFGPSKNR